MPVSTEDLNTTVGAELLGLDGLPVRKSGFGGIGVPRA